MRVLFVSLFIVVSDQLTKMFIKGFSISALGINIPGVPLGTSKPIIGDFLRFTYIENPGMAFGIDIGGKLFFSIFSIIASIGILLYLYKARNENLIFRFSLAMILGGAVGNLIDRVFYGVLFGDGPLFFGRVVDFIDADFFNINIFGYHLSRWPVFNIADASVTCGVILLLLSHRRSRKEEFPVLSPMDSSMTLPQNGSAIVGAPAVSPDPHTQQSPPITDPPQS